MNNWDETVALLNEAWASGEYGEAGLSLDICRIGTDELVFSHQAGGFDRQAILWVASAAKWVTALTVLSVVSQGALSLSTTTAQALGWQGKKGEITLEQGLSITTGFHAPPTKAPPCLYEASVSLADCAAWIHENLELTGEPGRFFSYGPLSQTIAGAMAEATAGQPFARLFTANIMEPLGMSPQTRYHPPSQLAGGLHICQADYNKLMALVGNQGALKGKNIVAAELVTQMGRDRVGEGTQVRFSPAKMNGRRTAYGLGCWLEVEDPELGLVDEDKAVLTSAGAWGALPFLDRAHGFYGTLFMFNRAAGLGEKSHRLWSRLLPGLRRALA